MVIEISSSLVVLASSAASKAPLLRNAVVIGSSAATLAALSVASSHFMGPSPAALPPQESILFFKVAPEAKATLCMALAMACHYLGYSIARPVTISLFTSASTGYHHFPPAFPLAMAMISPVSLLLLMSYGRVLEKYGPRGALMRSTLACAAIISGTGLAIQLFGDVLIGNVPAVKYMSGPLFVFRESYVQLLTSQYWSFMASVLTPNQSAKWFAPIAGLTSIASVVAGVGVSSLVEWAELPGALITVGAFLCLSLWGSSVAYDVADKYGFAPKKGASSHRPAPPGGGAKSESTITKAINVFQNQPILVALLKEILASQGLATLLNVCFMNKVGAAIPNDAERAGWVGKFYAVTNIITMVLQIVLLPLVMTVMEPRDLWRAVPVVSLLFIVYQAMQRHPSLYVVSASLLVMKVSEYSARRMLDEMVFVPLDYESRFVGKEVIGIFGYRLGKSLMSLTLSGLTALMGNFDMQQLSVLSSAVATLWLGTAWKLSNLVPTRKEAEEKYAMDKKQHKR